VEDGKEGGAMMDFKKARGCQKKGILKHI